MSFGNTVVKGDIALNEQYLLFPQCFLPFWEILCHCYKIGNFRLQTLSVWNRLKFVVWKRVNPFLNKPWFLRVCRTILLKALWEKEKLCFLLFWRTFCHFHQTCQNCHLQTLSVWKSLKFVVKQYYDMTVTPY